MNSAQFRCHHILVGLYIRNRTKYNYVSHFYFRFEIILYFNAQFILMLQFIYNKQKCEFRFQNCFRCFTSTRKIKKKQIFEKRNRHKLFDSNDSNESPYTNNSKYQKCLNLNLETIKIALISTRIKCEYLNATNRDQKDNIFATNNWYLGYDKCT